MKSRLISKISRYYNNKINKFGASPKGVDWNDVISQQIRFKQLTKIIDINKPITISDLGCGYGAYYLYLSQELSQTVQKYCGYDISDNMLSEAKNIIKSEKATFLKSDKILFNSDYSITSGIFNVKLDIEEKIWEDFILDTLSNMNKKSLKGFSFNCLTSYVDYKMNHLYYGDPLFFFDYCKNKFSRDVSLIHDYKLYEWTILVRRSV